MAMRSNEIKPNEGDFAQTPGFYNVCSIATFMAPVIKGN